MYALLIYLAGISDAVRLASGTIGSLALFTAIFCAAEGKWNDAISGKICVAFGILAITFCSLYPNSETIYKMAGVVGQDTGKITVTGQVKP